MKNFPNFIYAFIMLSIISGCQKSNIVQPKTVQHSYFLKSIASGPTDSTSFIYDVNMHLVKRIVLAPSSIGLSAPDSFVYSYHYNLIGQVDSINYSYPLSPIQRNSYTKYTFKYYANGSVAIINNILPSPSKVYNYDSLLYNAQNKVEAVTNYGFFVPGGMKKNTVSQYSYDANANPVKMIKSSDGQTPTEKDYVFDDKKSMYSGLPVDNYNQNFIQMNFGTDFIHANHNLVSCTDKYLGKTVKVIYQYNNDGYPILETYFPTPAGKDYRISYYVR
jgi:hypothetical protein